MVRISWFTMNVQMINLNYEKSSSRLFVGAHEVHVCHWLLLHSLDGHVQLHVSVTHTQSTFCARMIQ